MSDEHGRFAALAVEHVLGGLPATERLAFRAHLDVCDACRCRVAELRGIAADLAAAERDERELAPVRTEVSRRQPVGEQSGARRPRIGVRHVTVAAVAVALLAGAMGFWNLHLRSAGAHYLAVAQDRGETLALLAEGEALDVEVVARGHGVAARGPRDVAVSLTGLAALDEGSWLVGWVLDDADEVLSTLVLGAPGQLLDGSVAFSTAHHDGAVLVVTRETQGSTPSPTGPTAASIDLDPADG